MSDSPLSKPSPPPPPPRHPPDPPDESQRSPEASTSKSPGLHPDPSPESQKHLSWAQLLRQGNPSFETRVSSPILSRIHSATADRVSFSTEQAESWCQPWEKSLIGKFLGKPPPLDFVRRWVSRIWSTFGFQSALDLDKGFFVFRFDSIDSANRALTEGPWIFRGDVLRLMPWKPLFRPWEEMFTTSPVWIRLQSLPLEFWHHDSIVAIAQSFGKVLKVDDHSFSFE
ncbi:hypothetical protein Cni_G16613 [Canna indica]|uniref:DUF4283 domain-containing protein n=1 Tax=Canna indica TaxID=4628 RepID=A0AAQ3KGC6_9LILI|nr:hypothetical protein Cni_G16613 [Canna indica]